jgi:hypothetical protein
MRLMELWGKMEDGEKDQRAPQEYGMMERPRFIFAISDPPPTSNLFSEA